MYSKEFEKLLKFRPRKEEEELKKYIAISLHHTRVTTEMMLNTIDNIRSKYKVDNIALSGGVSLNCVTNGEIRRKFPDL